MSVFRTLFIAEPRGRESESPEIPWQVARNLLPLPAPAFDDSANGGNRLHEKNGKFLKRVCIRRVCRYSADVSEGYVIHFLLLIIFPRQDASGVSNLHPISHAWGFKLLMLVVPHQSELTRPQDIYIYIYIFLDDVLGSCSTFRCARGYYPRY